MRARGLLTATLLAAISGLHTAYGGQLKPDMRVSSTISPDSPYGYPNGPGWTCAHVKRMATKRRNRARHKLAVGRRK
jgi:hypothetical protein